MARLRFLLLAGVFFCQLAGAFSADVEQIRGQLAMAREDEDRYAEIELLRRLLDELPGDDEARSRLIDLSAQVADYSMAQQMLRKWPKAPEDLRARVIAAALFHRDGKREDACLVLTEYLDKHPADLAIVKQLIGYYAEIGEDAKTAALLAQTPGAGEEPALLVARALARRNLLDFAGALADFAAAEKVSSSDEAVSANRPSFERLKAGLPEFRAAGVALEKNPNDASALRVRAYWHLFTGFAASRAAADADAAMQAEPESVAGLLLATYALQQCHRIGQAEALKELDVDISKPLPPRKALLEIERSDTALTRNPDDVAARVARAYQLNDVPGQYQLAIKDANAAIALDPSSAQGYVEKIFALVKLRRFDEAASCVRLLESRNPPPEKLAAALSYMTEAAFASMKFDLALDFANRLIAVKPEAAYFKQRAAIFQRLDRTADAEADLQRAREVVEEKPKPKPKASPPKKKR